MNTDIFIPYAVFCEGFHENGDGTVSIGRVIDRISCVEKGDRGGGIFRRPAKVSLLHVQYAVCFQSAGPVTDIKATLRCSQPSGKQFNVGTKTLNLVGGYQGTFLTGTLNILPLENGWHIFDVLVNGAAKTQMVLHLSVSREPAERAMPHTNRTGAGKPGGVGFSHPGCYARALSNCSTKISRERYISDNFLKELNRSGGLRVGGLPWQKPGEVTAIPPNAMAANILCKRHNELLSKLDQLAGRFFKTLNEIHAACTGGHPSRNNSPLEIDGNHFEHVLLKILLGGLASGNLRGPSGTLFGIDLDLPILEVLFGEKEFPPSTGMFLLGQLNEPWLVERHIEVAAVVAAEQPVAVIVNIAPLRFALTVTPEGKNVAVIAGKSFFRPATITILGPNNSSHKILFKWPGESGHQDIAINYRDTPPGPLLSP